jgi:hypothetical protein
VLRLRPEIRGRDEIGFYAVEQRTAVNGRVVYFYCLLLSVRTRNLLYSFFTAWIENGMVREKDEVGSAERERKFDVRILY